MIQELSLSQLIRFVWQKKIWLLLGFLVGAIILSFYTIRFNQRISNETAYQQEILDQTQFYLEKVDPILEQLIHSRDDASKRLNTAQVTYNQSPFHSFTDSFWSGYIDYQVESNNQEKLQEYIELTNNSNFLQYINDRANITTQAVLLRQLIAINGSGLPSLLRVEMVAPTEDILDALRKNIKDYISQQSNDEVRLTVLSDNEVQNNWNFGTQRLSLLQERVNSIAKEVTQYQTEIDAYVQENMLMRSATKPKSPVLFGLMGGLLGFLLGGFGSAIQFVIKDRIDSIEELEAITPPSVRISRDDNGLISGSNVPVILGKTTRSELARTLTDEVKQIIVKEKITGRK